MPLLRIICWATIFLARIRRVTSRVISVSDRVESVASLESSQFTGLSRVESIATLDLNQVI